MRSSTRQSSCWFDISLEGSAAGLGVRLFAAPLSSVCLWSVAAVAATAAAAATAGVRTLGYDARRRISAFPRLVWLSWKCSLRARPWCFVVCSDDFSCLSQRESGAAVAAGATAEAAEEAATGRMNSLAVLVVVAVLCLKYCSALSGSSVQRVQWLPLVLVFVLALCCVLLFAVAAVFLLRFTR